MPITILLVDDQVLFRAALRTLLGTMEQFQVIAEADDGEEAVRLATTMTPDVVLMDLTLPGLDGFEATRQIRQIHPHTPVLLLTGYADQHAQRQAEHVGAAGLLEKSALDKLLAAITTASHLPA
jgi:NarL family two-component system response regulator LiaR